MPASGTHIERRRWQPRPGISALLRGAAFVVPVVASLAAARLAAELMPVPQRALGVIAWWGVLIGTALTAAYLVDRLSRRLLPLAVLFEMTMAFPDQAPSRFAVARRGASVRQLRRNLEAGDLQGDGDLRTVSETILALSTALTTHDRRTRGHSERVKGYADLIAEELGVPPADRDRLRWAALLHDVGKLAVSSEILNKDGDLTADEWQVVHRHPIEGVRLVEPMLPWLGPWVLTIGQHHEFWDGTGYPQGLQGESIFIGARIVSVADAYDAMTGVRTYGPVRGPAEARRELVATAGSQFDPRVVRALLGVSLGRLRGIMGPAAWLASVPFAGGFDRLGRHTAVLGSALLLAVGLGIAGASGPPDQEQTTVLGQVVAAADTSGGKGGAAGSSNPASETRTGRGVAPGSLGGEGAANAPLSEPSPDAGSEAVVTVTDTGSPTSTSAPTSTTTSVPDPTTTSTPAPTTTPTPSTTRPAPTDPAAPTAADDYASTEEDTPVAVAILANDSDRDGDLDPTTLVLVDPGTLGTATVEASLLHYLPHPDVVGLDRLAYRVCDSGSRCATAAVNIEITPLPDPPVALDDQATTDAADSVIIAVLANDTDPDGDVLTVASVDVPSLGSAVVQSDGTILYTPDGLGSIAFAYTACDPTGLCASAIATIEVSHLADTMAVDDAVITAGSHSQSFDVLANDTLGPQPWTVAIVSGPSSGVAGVIGNSRIRYKADQGFAGVDLVVYQVCDVTGGCDVARLEITVE